MQRGPSAESAAAALAAMPQPWMPNGDLPSPELPGARAELSITDDVALIGGRSHLPTDLHIDSGIDLSALLGERADRPGEDTRHEPAETMTPL